jgi:hypothetical protein
MPHGWDNFSIMAGTAAATLIGLLFVAITVTTGLPTSRIVQGTRGFLTPTLVRFAGVLFLSLAMLVPWPSAWPIAVILGLGGLTSLIYQTTVVIARHRVGLFLIDWHNWVPDVGVPVLGNASLIVGAVGLIADKSFAPYPIAEFGLTSKGRPSSRWQKEPAKSLQLDNQYQRRRLRAGC